MHDQTRNQVHRWKDKKIWKEVMKWLAPPRVAPLKIPPISRLSVLPLITSLGADGERLFRREHSEGIALFHGDLNVFWREDQQHADLMFSFWTRGEKVENKLAQSCTTLQCAFLQMGKIVLTGKGVILQWRIWRRWKYVYIQIKDIQRRRSLKLVMSNMQNTNTGLQEK